MVDSFFCSYFLLFVAFVLYFETYVRDWLQPAARFRSTSMPRMLAPVAVAVAVVVQIQQPKNQLQQMSQPRRRRLL
jgi:putative copper export protein